MVAEVPYTYGVAITEGDSDRVVVYVDVNDQGTGIAPEDIDRIFAEFVRRDRDTDGTGLGLSIARALSQASGEIRSNDCAPRLTRVTP